LDLKFAKSFGLKTIFVNRIGEDRELVDGDEAYIDLFATNFVDAAKKLGIKAE
jgi:hypothetical protein